MATSVSSSFQPTIEHTPVRSDNGRVIAAAVGICFLLEIVFFWWSRKGPPPHKTEFFFVEFVLILAGFIVFATLSLISNRSLSSVLPLIFLVLAWHTGFQITIGNNAQLVVTAIDVLVPVAVTAALIGRWNLQPGTSALKWIWLPLVVFSLFVAWGLAISVVRDVFWPAWFENLKSFLLYPPIALIVAWSIRSWRQLYYTVGFFLFLCLERAVEGLRQGRDTATAAQLSNGATFDRINGNFASVNQYALYMVTGLLILGAFFLVSPSTRRRLLLLVPLFLVGYAEILTLSRGSWLAGGISALLIAVLLGFRRALKLGAIALLVLIGAASVDHQLAAIVINRATTYTDSSTVEREQWGQMGLQVLQQYPLGAGWGAAFTESARGPVPLKSGFPWYHNDYLQLATEIGIPGVISFAWLWLAILLTGLRAFREALTPTQRTLVAGLVGAALASCVQAAFDQFFWLAAIAPHCWIVGGLVLSAGVLARKAKLEETELRAESEAAA